MVGSGIVKGAMKNPHEESEPGPFYPFTLSPGFSEHHTGRAIDLSTPGSRCLDVAFEQTPAFAWLRAHAADFGYYLSYPVGNPAGYHYEPWHWCWSDSQAANLPKAMR